MVAEVTTRPSVIVFDPWGEEVLHICSTIVERELHRKRVILTESNFHSFQRTEDLGHWHEVGQGILATGWVSAFKGLKFILVEGDCYRICRALDVNCEGVRIDAHVLKIAHLASSAKGLAEVCT